MLFFTFGPTFLLLKAGAGQLDSWTEKKFYEGATFKLLLAPNSYEMQPVCIRNKNNLARTSYEMKCTRKRTIRTEDEELSLSK